MWAIGRTSNAGLAPLAVGGAADYPQRGEKYNAPEAIALLPGPLAAAPASAKLVIDHDADIAKGLVDALAEHRDVVVSVLADLDGAPAALGLGALTPPSGDARLAAALGNVGAAIANDVRAHLTSDDPKVRALAVSVLAKLDGGKVTGADAAIAKALTDPVDQVRASAMNAVATLAQRRGSVPPDLAAALTKTLASGAWADRRVAALALGRLGAAADTAALTRAAKDPSSFVREAVAEALGRVAVPAVVGPLLDLSRDDVAQVRAAAARSLASVKDERAAKRRSELATDPDGSVRAAAGGR